VLTLLGKDIFISLNMIYRKQLDIVVNPKVIKLRKGYNVNIDDVLDGEDYGEN
jgi:hypothetical protein